MSDLKRKREDEDEDALGGLMGAYASSDESEEEPCDERGSQERPSHQVMEPNLASGGTDDAKEEEQAAGGNCSAEENDDGSGWRNELPFELREPPLGSPSDQVVKKCEKMLQLKAQGRSLAQQCLLDPIKGDIPPTCFSFQGSVGHAIHPCPCTSI